jgi:hypothetical protein
MSWKCLLKGHEYRRLASIGGVVEIVKCKRCGKIAIREVTRRII